MKLKLYIILILIALLTIAAVLYVKQDFAKSPPTLYYNGHIITIDEHNPMAASMLVVDGKIVSLGDKESLLEQGPKDVEKVDLNGRTVLPGFVDVHTHFALSMLLEGMHDLSGFKHSNNHEVWSHLEEVVKSKPPGEWIVCKGIDPILIGDLQTPSIQYLDSIAPSHPILIFSQSLHSYWANSLAFKLTDISSETKDPSEHSYYHKDQSGQLTGLIVEQEAFKPFIEILKDELLPTSL